jgi:hypothetical protein
MGVRAAAVTLETAGWRVLRGTGLVVWVGFGGAWVFVLGIEFGVGGSGTSGTGRLSTTERRRI